MDRVYCINTILSSRKIARDLSDKSSIVDGSLAIIMGQLVHTMTNTSMYRPILAEEYTKQGAYVEVCIFSGYGLLCRS